MPIFRFLRTRRRPPKSKVRRNKEHQRRTYDRVEGISDGDWTSYVYRQYFVQEGLFHPMWLPIKPQVKFGSINLALKLYNHNIIFNYIIISFGLYVFFIAELYFCKCPEILDSTKI